MWEIKGKNNQVKAIPSTKPEYNGEWMGESYVTVTVELPAPVNFEIGDYIIYRDERFEINYDPGKIKSAPRYEKGDAFKYENIKFNSLADELTRCDFLDIVLDDNQLHFTGLPKFSFYGGVKDLANRMQANLDRTYGKGTWSVVVSPEFHSTKEVNISVDTIKVQGALSILVNDLETYYTIKGRTITIGAAGIPAGHLFKYGKGNGLYEIEQNAEADQALVTRLRAYGSTRNLPHRYYNSLSGADGKKLIPDNMAVQYLMLPEFPYTTQDPYIDSPNIAKLGVREGTIFFDGSGELDEIYPSIEGMTAEQLKAAGVPCNSTGALDEIVSAEQMTDNGVGEINEGETQTTAKPPTFKVTLKDLGFNINDHLATETATLSFKTGMLGGRDFEIVGCKKIESGGKVTGYELELNRVYDDGIKLWFPYSAYNAQTGDKFVLLYIKMPEVYIKAAAQRLKEAATEWLSKNDYSRSIYAPKVDEIFMARQHDLAMASGGKIKSLHDTLKEGMLLLFEDEDLNIDASIFIDRLTIKEEGAVPTYEVVLKEEKTVGRLDKMQNQIDSLVAGKGQGGGGYTAAQIRSMIDAYGGTRFLSKIKDDRTPYKVSTDKAFEVGEFLSGVSGGIFGMDANTGDSFAEVARLYVRVKAFFEELTTVKASVLAGKQYITPGGGITCTEVEDTDTAYRCYFLSEQDGEKVETKIIAGDQAISEMFNAKTGASNKVSNHRYWRLVTAVNNDAYTDDNGNHYGYIDLSKADCEANSDIPQAGDEICQLGNRNDKTRQTAMMFSTVDTDAPSIKLFANIDSYTLTNRVIISFGRDPLTGQIFFRLGGADATQYLDYTQDKGLEIAGKLSIKSTIGNKLVSDYVNDAAQSAADAAKAELQANIDILQNQVDGVVESFNGLGAPTLTNYPANEWVTDDERKRHDRDIYTDITPYVDDVTTPTSGQSWKWYYNSPADYGWVKIADSDAVKALQLAAMSVRDTDVLYISHTSQTAAPALPSVNADGAITDAKGWQTSAPAWSPTMYIWQTTYVRKGDGNAYFSDPTCISGYNGKDGTSVTISSTEVRYSTAYNSSTQPADSTFTLTAVPSLSAGQYLWCRTTVTYNNGQSTKSYAVSRTGEDGGSFSNNLLKGTKDFKSGVWSRYSSVEAGQRDGLTVLHRDNSAGASYVEVANTTYTLENDTVYTFSAWMKGSGKTNMYIHPNVTARILQVEEGTKIPSATAPDTGVVRTLTAEWRRYYTVFRTLASGDLANKNVLLRAYSGTDVYLCGVKLEKGANPAPEWSPEAGEMLGVTIVSKSVTYAKTTGALQPSDSAFTYGSIGAAGFKPGDYMWTKSEVAYSDGQVLKSYSVGRVGGDGADGVPGADGYTHLAYANSADGITDFSTTYFAGAKYLGVCADHSAADPTTPSSYEWGRFRGEDGTNAKVVAVNAEAQVFVYRDDFKTLVGPSSIKIAATVQGVTNPTYQWSYKTPSMPSFTNIGTGDSYTLSATASGWGSDRSMTLRCTVDGVHDEVTIAKVSSGSNGSSYSSNLMVCTAERREITKAAAGDWYTVYPDMTVTLEQGKQYTISGVTNAAAFSGIHGSGNTADRCVLWLCSSASSPQGTVNRIVSGADMTTDGSKGHTFTWDRPDGVYYLRTNFYIAGTWWVERVKVEEGKVTDTQWSPAASEMVGQDAYTVIMGNESHVFEGDTQKAVAATTECGITAYKGAELVKAALPASLSGLPAGMTYTRLATDSTAARFRIGVTSALTQRQGTVTVPVTVDGKSFDKVFSWSLSLQGRGITGTTEWYAVNDSPTVPPGDAEFVQSPIPQTSTGNRYLWNYEKTTYTDNTYISTQKHVISVHGQNGTGITKIENFLLASAKAHGVTVSEAGWTTDAASAAATVSADKPYLWNYEKITYTQGNPTQTQPHVVGRFGSDGENAQTIYLRGSQNNHPAGERNRVVRVNGKDLVNAADNRGVTLLTLDRKTLAKVFQGNYDLYGNPTNATDSLVAKLDTLDDSVFVTLTSYDAMAMQQSLRSKLAEFGGIIDTTFGAERRAFAFLGYKGCPKGYAQWMLDKVTGTATSAPAEVSVYVADGMFTTSATQVGIKSVTEQYYLSTSRTELQGGSWSDTRQPWVAGRFYWTRSKVTYTDGTVAYIGEVCVTGETGAAAPNLVARYSADGSSWHSVYQQGDQYMQTSADGGTTWGESVRITGASYTPNLLLGTAGKELVSTGGSRVSNSFDTVEDLRSLAGKVVTISFEYEYSGVTTGETFMYARFGGEIEYITPSGKKFLGCWVSLPTNSTGLSGRGKKSLTVSLAADAGDAAAAISVYRFFIQVTGGNVRLWDFKMEEGRNPDPQWTPAASEMVGEDGRWRKFQWAKNSSTTTAPTSGWSDTPMTAAAGEYVWMRSGLVVPPATIPAKWDDATRLTGDTGTKGEDGSSTYQLDLTNEVQGILCDASGNVTVSYPSSQATVFKGSQKLTSGVSYSIASKTGITNASITSAGVVTMSGMTADTAVITVQAVADGLTLQGNINLYKVKPGAPYSNNLLTGTKDWKGWARSGVYSAGGERDGLAVMHGVVTAESSGAYYGLQLPGKTDFENDTVYTLSMWAKGSGRFDTFCYPNVNAQKIVVDGVATTATESDTRAQHTLTQEWKRYYVVFRTIASGSLTGKTVIAARIYKTAPTEIWIAGAKLEKGRNDETQWSPAAVEMAGTDAKVVVVNATDQAFSYTDNFASAATPAEITLSATLQGCSGYQWQYKVPGQSSFSNISGATASTYKLSPTASIWGASRVITLRCVSSGDAHDEVTIAKVSSGSNGSDGSSYSANMLLNGDFHDGRDKWPNWGSSDIVTLGDYNDKTWARIVTPATRFSGIQQSNTQPLAAGKTYTFSATLRGASAGQKFGIGIHLIDSSGTIVSQPWSALFPVGTEPERVVWSFTVGASLSIARYNLMLGNGNQAVATDIFITDIKLEEGKNPDPVWSPNPSEMVGEDGYTVLLSNESHTFAGGTAAAVQSSTSCDIVAYKGATRVAATIGPITGAPAGMTVTTANNGTANATFAVQVTTALIQTQGMLNIPITVDGKAFTRKFSWSLALKGATGATGAAAVVYDIIPSTDFVTRSSTGTASASTVSCTVYKTTGNSARAASNDHTLKYTRLPDNATGTLTRTNGVSAGVAVLANTTAIIFELTNSAGVMLDRERVPVVTDAGDFVPPGQNLLLNSGFTQGPLRWIFPAAGVAVDTGVTHDGSFAVKIDAAGYDSNVWRGITQDYGQNESLKNPMTGEWYAFSVWAYCETDADLASIDQGAQLEYSWYRDGGTRTQYSVSIKPTQAGQWQRFSIIRACPADAVSLRFSAFVTRNGRLWLAAPMVTRGTRLSDWSPSPQDTGYLQRALLESGTIDGGLILASLLRLGYTDEAAKVYRVMAGMSGIYKSNDSVFLWGGGDVDDDDASNATMAFRMNGTGFAANKVIKFNHDNIMVGDDIMLDVNGLTLFDSAGSPRLTITNNSVGTDIDVSTGSEQFPATTRDMTVDLVRTRLNMYVLVPYTAIAWDIPLGSSSLGAGSQISMNTAVRIDLGDLPDLLGYDVKIQGNVIAQIKNSSGTTVHTTQAYFSRVGTTRYYDAPLSMLFSVKTAGVYKMSFTIPQGKNVNLSTGPHRGIRVEFPAKSITVAHNYQTQTVLGNDGLRSTWGGAAMLMNASTFLARVGNYGIRITAADGIKINRNDGKGYVSL